MNLVLLFGLHEKLADLADIFQPECSESANAIFPERPVVFPTFPENTPEGAVAFTTDAHLH